MPIFSNVKSELKEEVKHIINLTEQEDVNYAELSIRCKKFFDLVFLDYNESCTYECCEFFLSYISSTPASDFFIPNEIKVLTIELSFLYTQFSGDGTNFNNNYD